MFLYTLYIYEMFLFSVFSNVIVLGDMNVKHKSIDRSEEDEVVSQWCFRKLLRIKLFWINI